MQPYGYESRHRHSIFCIVPPHMLRAIARHGNAAQRNSALDTLALDGTMRIQRLVFQMMGGVAPRPVLSAAPRKSSGQSIPPRTPRPSRARSSVRKAKMPRAIRK